MTAHHQDEVDRKLGDVLVESVRLGTSNRVWLRRMTVLVLLDVLLLLLIAGGYLQVRHNAKVACERTNSQGVAYVKQWTPVLRAPRPPLREGATAQERDAYDANTALRTQWEKDLRRFDPVKC